MSDREGGFLLSGWRGTRKVAGIFRLTLVLVSGVFWVIARPVAWRSEDLDHCM